MVDVPLAHRGLHGVDAPENSLAAFAAAVDASCGVELDVYVTADDVAVVVHDADLSRVAGIDLNVRTATYAQLCEHPLADGSVVPTLAEVLDLIGEAPVMVELKNDGRSVTGKEGAIAAVLDAAPHARAYVASFHPSSLRWFRRNRPQIMRAQTARASFDPRVPSAITKASARLAFNGRSLPHLLSYEVAGLNHPAVRRWRERGGVVLAWTVRTRTELRLAEMRADNVIFETIPPPLH